MASKFRQLLRCPPTPLIAGAVFVTSVVLLPVEVRSPSLAGRALYSLMGPHARGNYCAANSPTKMYNPTSNGLVAVPDNAAPAPNAVIVALDCGSGSEGLWAPTTYRWCERITVYAPNLPPAGLGALRAQFVNDLIAEGDLAIASEMPGILTTDAYHSKILWMGWVHNAVSLASLLTLAASLPALPRWIRTQRRRRRGLCPACSYDLIATPPGAPCPECGTISRRRPATPAPPRL